MAKTILVFVLQLFVSRLCLTYVIYQQDLTQSYIPIVTQEINPYAIAQHNDIVRKINQMFSCPFCCPICEEIKTREEKDNEEEEIKPETFSPVEEELALLNVVPLKTTERSVLDEVEELKRSNEILKEFLQDTKTVKKESPGGSLKESNVTFVAA